MSNFRCATCVTVDAVKTCTYSNKIWRIFYPNCKRTNLLCSKLRGAYVPVITVCIQNL